MGRIQSPSSINTFKQCPRKYFYSYILRLPRSTNIHCLRGNIVHEVLEEFFNINLDGVNETNFTPRISSHLKGLFNMKWDKNKKALNELNMNPEELQFYYQDSLMMIANWANTIIKRIHNHMETTNFQEAFTQIKPDLIEQKFSSDFYKVMGYIDYIHTKDGKVKVMDYKTSKSPDMKPEYRLQLGIYALLYEEKFGHLPDEVGLWILKFGEQSLPVTEDLIKDAKFEIEQIHLSTETNEIKDYPKKTSPLCKYSSGQCEFYDHCFGLKTEISERNE